jgi:hypothetical protein
VSPEGIRHDQLKCGFQWDQIWRDGREAKRTALLKRRGNTHEGSNPSLSVSPRSSTIGEIEVEQANLNIPGIILQVKPGASISGGCGFESRRGGFAGLVS